MSLLSGEFVLSSAGSFEIGSWDDGFSMFSWRARGSAGDGDVVPTLLAMSDWRRVRNALDSPSTAIAPGYRKRSRLGMHRACEVVSALPQAGFVTPSAASSPVEDYAELFAHAILADEGKIHNGDTIRVSVPGCDGYLMPTPYAATGVSAKREYMESRLGLGR
jgi:hypothetical protein